MSNAKTNIFFDIISEYKANGAKQAEKSLGDLSTLASKAAKAFAGVFAADKAIAFGKASITAFMEANKAFTTLATTLNNQGFQVSIDQLGKFFDGLEAKFGKDKSVLIPAFQNLVNATGDITKSQQLLNLAMDVSQGTGRDLASVSTAIGKAYLGQYTALGKLGVGLSKADLTATHFSVVQDKLTQKFGGTALAAADSYAGKIDKLKVAYGNMQETIGGGLVDGISKAFAGSSIGGFETAMKNVAEYVANVAVGMGVIAQRINSIVHAIPQPILKAILSVKNFGAFGLIQNLGKENKQAAADMLASLDDQVAAQLANYNAKKKVAQQAALQLAAENKIIAAQKAQIQAAKDKKALDQASTFLNSFNQVFDLTAIERYAALSQSTVESDKLRLKLMQDMDALQNAISSGNAKLAQQLEATVKQDMINLATLQGGLNNLKSPDNPLKSLIDDIFAAIDALKLLQAEMAKAFRISSGSLYISSTGQSSDTTSGTWGQYYKGLSGGLYGSTPAVVNQTTYNIAGSVVSDQMLSQTLANNNASGINSNINRVNVTYA